MAVVRCRRINVSTPSASRARSAVQVALVGKVVRVDERLANHLCERGSYPHARLGPTPLPRRRAQAT
jgi:hypothetical protein